MRNVARRACDLQAGTLLATFLAALTLVFGAAPVEAASFVVDSTADTVDVSPGDGVCADASNDCTLRAAILETNALAGSDTISLPADTYTLTIPGVGEGVSATGDLDITDDLTIVGAGAATTIIDADRIENVFQIHGGASVLIVELSGLTIQNGFVSESSHSGNGGGIWVDQGTELTLRDSVVRDNQAGDDGGGIKNHGTLTIIGSAITGNSSDSAGGGGINSFGTLTIIDSLISGNRADLQGGHAISSTDLTLVNSTVSGNGNAIAPGAEATILVSGSAVLTSSTVTGNYGIGVFAGWVPPITIELKNTIVADNVFADCAVNAPGAVISSSGHNIDSDGSCTLTEPTDLPNTNPIMLGPLADNGGATLTHALLAGSPAIDAGIDVGLTTDQRGVTRPQGFGFDIGAFELELTAAGGFSGSLAVPGFSLLETTEDTTPEDLVDSLALAGCNALTIMVTIGGSWVVYIPGAPAFVNAAFPPVIASGTPFFVDCAASPHEPILRATFDSDAVGGTPLPLPPGLPTDDQLSFFAADGPHALVTTHPAFSTNGLRFFRGSAPAAPFVRFLTGAHDPIVQSYYIRIVGVSVLDEFPAKLELVFFGEVGGLSDALFAIHVMDGSVDLVTAGISSPIGPYAPGAEVTRSASIRSPGWLRFL